MKLGDTIFNGNQFKNIILNSVSFKRLILEGNLVWSYFSIAIKSFKTRILADGGTYEAESILEDRLQEITPNLFDSASLVITPNGVKTSKLYTIKPNDGTGDLTVVRNTSATRIDENGNIVDVSANVARIDYSNGSPAILVEPQRTNLVYPIDIATTQVRAVTAVAHTLSFYGSGSVALSGAFSGTLNGTGTNNRVSLTFTPIAGNLTLTVNGSVTNWQLEAGSNATSLIRTVSGSVTRNDEVISKNGISNLIGQTEGTIFIDVYITKFIQNYTRIFFDISSIDTSNRLYIDMPSSTNGNLIQSAIRANSVFQVISERKVISLGRIKAALAYKSGDCAFYVNGSKINFTTNNTFIFSANFDLITIGSRTTSMLSDSISDFIVYKTRLSDTQLQQLTTL